MKQSAPLISVHGFGLSTPHTTDVVIDRPHSEGDYLLMCFSTPFFIRTSNGVETGAPGDGIVHTPAFPVYHGTPAGMTEGFRNDWIFMTGPLVPRLLSRYRIPLNRLIPLGESTILTPFLREIQREKDAMEPYWEQAIRDASARMILQIARAMESAAKPQLSHTDKSWKPEFLNLRGQIANAPHQPWTVPRMAKQLHLSTNRFSVLYQKFFSISPMEDVIEKRIQLAQWYLSSSKMSVTQVADRCGFSTPFYFMRLFKKRTGRTPGEFARTIKPG